MHPVNRLSSVMFALALAAIFTGSVGILSADAASSVPFLPHQAVYDLSLQKSRGNATVNNAKGASCTISPAAFAKATPRISAKSRSSIPARANRRSAICARQAGKMVTAIITVSRSRRG